MDKEKVASIIAQALKKQEETTDRPDAPPQPIAPREQIIDIHFERADKGLGLSIAGGLGSTPYKDNDEGIFISRVTAGGPAECAGLKKDDKVLSVNGHNFVGIDHYEAVNILKAQGSDITMKVAREGPPVTNGHHAPAPSPHAQQLPQDSVSLSSLSQPGSSHSKTSLVNKSLQSPSLHEASNNLAQSPSGLSQSSKIERVYTSLMRDYNNSFGFSISGGKGADSYIEGDEAVYISKVVEHGPAHRDGKIRVGDKLVQIDGMDVSEAEHAKVVEMLTGRKQFVRLCVERRTLEFLDSSGSPDGKSPKIFGLPRPYTGLYSSSSYMANRPSYVRNREPGQYTLDSKKTSTSSTSSLGRLPGKNSALLKCAFYLPALIEVIARHRALLS